MIIRDTARLVEQAKFITAFPPAVPSSAAPPRISMKGFGRLTIVLMADNATTVTGSAIALTQADAAAVGTTKALPFTKAWRNIDTGAGQALSEFAVVANTFTTDATDAKNLMYVIEVHAEDLDTENGFNWVELDIGNATASAIAALYILWPGQHSSPGLA